MNLPLSFIGEGLYFFIHADLFSHKSKNYLVMCDYYSRWIEVLNLTSTSSIATICQMKDIFARFGIPCEIVSDNGLQFVLGEFADFATKYSFHHVTSSLYLPNSNGEANQTFQTAKQMLGLPWLALLVYRDTPIAATGVSPSQLMMGKHLCTTLPVPAATLEQQLWPDHEAVLERDNPVQTCSLTLP